MSTFPRPWEIHDCLRRRQAAMVALLGRLVRLESPSTDRQAIDRLARFLAREWRRRGARVRLLKQRQRGDILRAEISLTPYPPRGQLLILGHMDTVYERGSLKRTPFRVRRGRAYGPGTLDMKSGLVQALFAVDALTAMNLHPGARLVFLFTSDEEIGSAVARPVLEREARRSHAVLVVEPASGEHGALKTARKGVGEFTLEVTGRAAHAGIEPGQGVNAIEELAAQLVRLKRLQRSSLTLNANVIEGGTRTNVIAAQARARVDVRIARRADGPWIEKRIRSLRPVNRRAKLTVRGGINRPPLERTPEVARLFQHAQMVARSFDMELEESSTGGGSDGSFTSALGVPTLDGLGGVGGGAHTAEEFVFVGKMPERACLLASLLLTL